MDLAWHSYVAKPDFFVCQSLVTFQTIVSGLLFIIVCFDFLGCAFSVVFIH